MTPDQQVRQHIADAKADLTDALGHLQRLLPRSTTLTRLVLTGDPGCESCRRVKAPRGDKQLWTETRTGNGGLCRWCEDETRARRKTWTEANPGKEQPPPKRLWPSLRAVEWHRDTGKERATPSVRAEWDAWERALKVKAKKVRKAS